MERAQKATGKQLKVRNSDDSQPPITEVFQHLHGASTKALEEMEESYKPG